MSKDKNPNMQSNSSLVKSFRSFLLFIAILVKILKRVLYICYLYVYTKYIVLKILYISFNIWYTTVC